MPDWQYKCWDEASLSQALCEPNPNPCPKGKGEEDARNTTARSGEGCWLDYMPLYVKQAYEARKFAFVSDYVRLWALERYGGIYVDTDVKVLKSYEQLLIDTAFIGMEESKAHLPGTCVIGCEPHCQWLKDMLSLYEGIEFVKPDGSFDLTTNVQRLGERMKAQGLNKQTSEDDKPWNRIQYLEEWGLRVYTHDYFSPITSTHIMQKTNNTYSIHYFAGSWVERTRGQIIKAWIFDHILGRRLTDKLVQIKRKMMGR